MQVPPGVDSGKRPLPHGCEDSLSDKTYFDAVYREACELTAYLCSLYSLNPMGTAACGNVQCPVILCHHDSYRYGLGSNHGDVDHWFSKFGKSMDTARQDVQALLQGVDSAPPAAAPPAKEEEDVVTYEQFKEFMEQYRKELQDREGNAWSQSDREWAISTGLVQGNEKGRYMWQDFLTREQGVCLMRRLSGKA